MMGVMKQTRGRITALFMGIVLTCVFMGVCARTADAAPASNPVTLTVEQRFTKPEASAPADTFTYTLTEQETGNPMPSGSSGGVYTVRVKGTDSINLEPISFTQAGTYHYQLEQSVPSAAAGYTYDTQVYTITIYVDSSLQVNVIINNQEGTKTERIEFENVYAPLASDPSQMVDYPINVTIQGNPDSDSIFTFQLEPQGASARTAAGTQPAPYGLRTMAYSVRLSADDVQTLSSAGKTTSIVGSGTDSFGTWTYTEAGTYYYTISQVDHGESGYTYDTTVYTLTDTVRDVDGQLVVSRIVTNAAGKQVSAYDFINQYTRSSAGGGTGGGTTIGTGTGPKTGDTSMTGLYQAMMGISSLLLLICVAYLFLDRNHKRNQA